MLDRASSREILVRTDKEIQDPWHRVHLEEVEHVVAAHTHVHEAAVLATARELACR